ncbi:Transmembrane emp24 domain-containing protein 1 [Formica fusca]
MSYHHIQLVLLGVFLFLIAPFKTEISFSVKTVPKKVAVKDYKVHIDAGKEECYYQYVNSGAILYISFQILRGGDKKAGFEMKNPEGIIIYPWQWQCNDNYQERSVNGGYYSICIDNRLSLASPKIVKLYFMAIRSDQWQQYKQEVEEQNLSIQNFTNAIMNVEKNIDEMLRILHWKRSREEKNMNLLLNNSSYVQMWSITQVIVIIVTIMVQVYFIRKLFHLNNKICS